MKKRYYYSIIDFEAEINADKVIKSNEARLYFKDEFVYKIFDGSLYPYYWEKVDRIRIIKNLNPDMFAIPIELIYASGKYRGFKMLNVGITLWDIMLYTEISLEEKKLIAYQLKDISEYLKRKRLLYPDIHLYNLLYLNNQVRLVDTNGILRLNEARKIKCINMPELYKCWAKIYGLESLNYVEINFMMHILFNIPKDELYYISEKDKLSNIFMEPYYLRLLGYRNTAFDDNAYQYFESCFTDNERVKTLSLDTYLVDHLK